MKRTQTSDPEEEKPPKKKKSKVSKEEEDDGSDWDWCANNSGQISLHGEVSRFFKKDELVACPICSEKICKDCAKPGAKSIWNDDAYIGEISNLCSKCGRAGCQICIRTCLGCKGAPFVCKDCSDLKLGCDLHMWYSCDKIHDHEQELWPETNETIPVCEICRANYNYACKMGYPPK